jgi:poly(A) polymerase
VVEPVIVRRDAHGLSRRDIDPDALKVLYRLREHGHTAYLVGGSVRDLLLGRRPKDFDIGTDAHPYQIKRLFRNCWIIGRRFRLAHVKFGPKTIEVATFRRVLADVPRAEDETVVADTSPTSTDMAQLHRDNTFGTPEEDAFRRDFTINGLFYDIATFSVIDYVGGLADLEKRVVRSIGDPFVRFVEDPVRMLRAIVMSARLGFDLDPMVTEAIATHRTLLAQASPARLLEEYFKILRAGAAEATFRGLARARLLEQVTPELQTAPDAVWDSLARLDRYRQRFVSTPEELTNALLIGTLVQPLGTFAKPLHGRSHPHADRVSFGILPVARRDIERLRQVVDMAPKLLDATLPPRVVRSLPHRPSFADAVTWIDIHADAPHAVTEWRNAQHRRAAHAHEAVDTAGPGEAPAMHDLPRRRRRRRRRRGGRTPQPES